MTLYPPSSLSKSLLFSMAFQWHDVQIQKSYAHRDTYIELWPVQKFEIEEEHSRWGTLVLTSSLGKLFIIRSTSKQNFPTEIAG
jgi:hypothetical protein